MSGIRRFTMLVRLSGMIRLCLLLLVALQTVLCLTTNTSDSPCETEDIRKLVDATSRTWSIGDDAVETHGLQTVLDCARDGDTVSLKTTKTIRPNSRLVVRKKLTIKGQPPLRNEKMEGNRRASLTCPPGEGLFLLRNAVALENLDIEGCYLKSDASVHGIVVADACSEESGRRLLALRGVAFIENQNFGGSIGPSVEKAACYEIEMKAVQFNGNKFSRSATLGSVNRLTDVRLDGNVGKAYFFEFANGSDTRVHDMKAAKNKGGVLNFIESDAIVNGSRFESNEVPDCAVRCRDSKVNFSSTVFDDNASPVAGAAVSMTGGEGMFFNVSATNNSAERGSAFSIVDSKMIAFNSCRFESNVASDGGALRVEAKSEGSEGSLEIVDSDFAKNRGGAVYVQLWNSSSMIVGQSRFRDNVAGSLETSRNGGLHVDSTLGLHLRIQETIFERNIGGAGGAILLTNITGKICLTLLTFENNSAPMNGANGGAVSIGPSLGAKLSVIFLHCLFKGNTASNTGGALAAMDEDIILVIVLSIFDRNNASNGGALAVRRAKLAYLDRCTFKNNRAKSEGGAIWINDITKCLRALNCNFIRNRAHSGGAVMSDQTDLIIKSSRFQENKAVDRGGAMRLRSGTDEAVIGNSSFRFNQAARGGALFMSGTKRATIKEGSLFEGNVATVYGGAIHILLYRTIDKFFLGDSNVVGNKAAIGGGAFIDLDRCRGRAREKSNVRIRRTSFRRNRAVKAGGAYFVDRLDIVNTDCRFKDFSPWTLENGSVVSNMECSNMKDNAVDDGGYGPNVATSATTFYAVLHYSNGSAVTKEQGSEVLFDNWASGASLPKVEVVVLDAFHQGPALTNTGSKQGSDRNPNLADEFEGYAKATLSPTSELRLIPNPLITDVHVGRGNITMGEPIQSPGEYVLSLWVGDNREESIKMTVKMRECLLNEEAILGNKTCHACGINHYSFDSGTECRPCPERLNCSKWGLFPEEHRWLPSPCSTKVRRCLSRMACSFGDRADKIGEFFDEVPPPMTCDALNASSLKLFNNLQCNTGYEGVLCGTCSEGYGQYDLECSRCKGKAVVTLWLLARTSWLFMVCAAAVISSLSDVGAFMVPIRASFMTAASTITLPTPSEVHLETECDIAQKNMTESVKILLNFAQLNSVAVTINTTWTRSIRRTMRLLGLLGAMAVDATVSLDCFFDKSGNTPRSIGGAVIRLLIPIFVFLVGAIVWAIVLHRDRVTLTRRLVLSAVVVFYISFIGWVEELAAALNCVTVDDGGGLPRRLWTEDTSVECFVGSHSVLVWVLVVPLILALTGFAFGTPLYLYRQKHNNDLNALPIQEMFGFMYAAYKPDCVFWESAVLIRKALLALVVVFGGSMGSTIQSITAISILILTLFLQTWFMPYKEAFRGLNSGQVYSSLVVIFTFISAIYFYDPHVGDEARAIVTLAALTITVGFIIYISYAIFHRFVIFCRLTLERDEVIPSDDKRSIAVVMCWVRHQLSKSRKTTSHSSHA